jgi:hypothetical protein
MKIRTIPSVPRRSTLRLLCVALTGALALFTHTTFAQTWQTPCTAVAALSFNGSGDYVQIPGFCSNAPTTEVTVEFWQKVSAVRAQSTFCQGDVFDSGNVFNAHVPYADGSVYWDFGDINNGGRLGYLPPVSLVGTWQHFALEASQNGNFMRIYRNGVLEAQQAGMTPYQGGNWDLHIGGETSPFYIPFGGLIDEFRIWNVARTQGQILGNMRRSLTTPQSGLVAYWRFDEGAGTMAGDSSGQGRNANLFGPSWVPSTAPFLLPSAPRLSIAHSNSEMVLTWPSAQACFGLQESSPLGAAWVNVTNQPALVGNWNQVILPASTGHKMYRLISQ